MKNLYYLKIIQKKVFEFVITKFDLKIQSNFEIPKCFENKIYKVDNLYATYQYNKNDIKCFHDFDSKSFIDNLKNRLTQKIASEIIDFVHFEIIDNLYDYKVLAKINIIK